MCRVGFGIYTRIEVGGQAVLGRQYTSSTPWLTERHGYDPTSCTKEVKACLTDENRCGKDYANCVGLDLESIQELCPMEKLVGCQKDGAEATWNTIANIVQGIYMNIDNSLLNQCVNIVNAKMTEICGDADGGCGAFAADENMGTESLFGTKRNDGSFEISGLVSFYNVKVKETQSTTDDVKFGKYELDINDYADHLDKLADADSASKERVLSNLRGVQSKINQKIAVLTSDPKVSMCVYGRDMKQIRSRKDAPEKTTARFPNLLDSSINLIINSGLDQANNNYSKKFKEVMAEFTDKQNDEVKTALCAAMASNDKGLKCRQSFLNGTKCDVFVNQAALGFQDAEDGGYGLKIVLGGMKQNELLKMASKNTGEYITTDSKSGSMLGKITMSAVYSAENNTCNVTTVTQMCKNAKDVYDAYSSCGSGGIRVLGGGGCSGNGGGLVSIGGGGTTNSSTYAGAMCTSYAEPTTTTQQIKM